MAVGKTTLIGVICKYINDNPEFLIKKNSLEETNSLEGILFFEDLLNMFEKAHFPDRTSLGCAYEIRLPFQMKASKEFLFEFIDISGEHLKDFFFFNERSSEEYFQSPEFIKKHLKDCNVLFLTTDISDSNRDDKNFFELLLKIRELFREEKRIAIVINKWDEIHPSITFNAFVQRHFKQTLSAINVLRIKNIKFFKFSVGRVIVNRSIDIEFQLDFENAKRIVEWIIDGNGDSSEILQKNELEKLVSDSNEFKLNLRELVAQNELSSVFEILSQMINGQNSNILVNTRSRAKKNDSLKNQGVISFEKYLEEENKIKAIILELIDDL